MMRSYYIGVCVLLLTVCGHSLSWGQTFVKLIGETNVREGGGAIAGMPDGGVVVGGYKNNLPWVIRFDVQGNILWERTLPPVAGFDTEIHYLAVTPGQRIIGTGNSSVNSSAIVQKRDGFWFEMDFNGNLIYMHRENNPEDVVFENIMITSNGQYWMPKMYQDLGSPNFTDQGLVRIDPTSGNIISQSPRYNVTSNPYIDDVSGAVAVPGRGFYMTGRYYVNGANNSSMRPYLTHYDANGQLQWSNFHLVDNQSTARLYGVDCMDNGNGILVVGFGDPYGTSTNFRPLSYLTDYNGNVIRANYYDIQFNNWASSVELVAAMAADANQVVILGSADIGNQIDILLMSIDRATGNPNWTKSYGAGAGTDRANHLSNGVTIHQGHIWFVANIEEMGEEYLYLAKTDLLGNAACDDTTSWATTTVPAPLYTGNQNPSNYVLNVTSSPQSPATPLVTPECGFLPDPNLGPDTVMCGTLVLDPQISSPVAYTWSTGAWTPTITISQPGTYVVTVSLSCCRKADTIVVTQGQGSLNLPPSASVCSGSSIQLTAPGGFTNYQWNTGATTSTITVSTSGTYSVTASINGQCTATDTTIVTVNPLPTPNLGPDLSICTGSSLTLSAGNYSSYAWSTGATSSSISVSSAGTYQVTVTDAAGCQGTDAITVSLLPLPSPNLGPDLTICDDSTVLLTPGAGFAAYQWALPNGGSSSNTSVTSSNQGTYHVTVTDANGCTAADSLILTLLPAPVVNFGQDTLICIGLTLTLYATNPNASYLWNDNSTADTLLVTGPGTYAVTVTATNGCDDVDDIQVVFDNYIQVNFGSDLNRCVGDSVYLLAGPPGLNYIWAHGPTANALTVNTTGLYAVTVSDTTTCVGSDSIYIEFHALPLVDIGPDVFICDGSQAPVSGPPGMVGYVWSGAGSAGVSQNSTVSQAGTCYLTVTDIHQCENTDSLLVTVWPLPPVSAGPDTSTCTGVPVTLTASPPGLSFLWSSGQTSQSITTQNGGIIFVSGTDANGCENTDSVLVTIHPLPAVDLGPDQDACDGDIVLLDAGNQGQSYLWNDGQTASFIQITQDGQYAVTVTSSFGCINQDQVSVTFHNLPTVDIGPDQVICNGSSFSLDAGFGFTGYQWSNGASTQSTAVTTEGTHAVTVTDVFGCENSDEMFLGFIVEPALNLGKDTSICGASEYRLISNLPSTYFEWQDGSRDEFYVVTETGWYVLTIQGECGLVTDSIHVDMDDHRKVFVPTAFTPNGDGINDLFEVKGPYQGFFEWQIYDRWGKLVFQAENMAFQWDGKFSGVELPEGVYAYRMTVEDCHGKRYPQGGSITLVR